MIHAPQNALDICKALRTNGFQAWLVGGAVRDALMDREPHDWDIATDALPEQVQRVFTRTIPTGIDHGTVTVLWDGEPFEVTTFRGDSTYSDGRHPDSVSFLSEITGDLARRDFTMNAIAYDPLTGKYADPFGGMADIQAGLIRAVGNAEQRFAEDGLRALRAARFAATLEFDLDSTTAAALRPALGSYAKVSHERIRDEWMKAMAAPKPSKAFQVMLDHGILGHTVPEFMELVGCKQNRYHEYDVWDHTMVTLDNVPKGDPILRMGALFHDIGKPATRCFQEKTQDYTFYDHEVVGAEMVATILGKMRFSLVEKQRVEALVRHHMIKYDSSWTDSAVRRWVRKVSRDHLESLHTLARADILGKGNAKTPMDSAAIEELFQRISALEAAAATPTTTKMLCITGHDVMRHLGIPAGPQVGVVLQELLEKVVDNPELNNPTELLKMAQEVQRAGV